MSSCFQRREVAAMTVGKKSSYRAGAFFLFVLLLAHPLAGHAKDGKQDQLLASRIIDQAVFNKQGEKVGQVDDLIVKRRNGLVTKLTVELGGFDLGDKLIAVWFGDAEIGKNGGIVLDVTREQLAKKPAFSYQESGLRPEYFQARPYAGPSYYAPPIFFYPPSPSRLFPAERAFSPRRFLASDVIDHYVINERGEYLGEVKDLLINKKDRIDKILISSGGILGEDTYIALPYKPLGFTVFGSIYDIGLRELKNLPRYHHED
jgi:sporulation protein YlmC with PRC-barrel domain